MPLRRRVPQEARQIQPSGPQLGRAICKTPCNSQGLECESAQAGARPANNILCRLDSLPPRYGWHRAASHLASTLLIPSHPGIRYCVAGTLARMGRGRFCDPLTWFLPLHPFFVARFSPVYRASSAAFCVRHHARGPRVNGHRPRAAIRNDTPTMSLPRTHGGSVKPQITRFPFHLLER